MTLEPLKKIIANCIYQVTFAPKYNEQIFKPILN
jgi:hypothetical protein